MKLGRYIFLLSIILTFVSVAVNGFGEPRYDVQGDLIRSGAEEFSGILNSINLNTTNNGNASVLINDSIFTVDSEAIFRNKEGGSATLGSFTPGMTVKFFALGSLLTKMWPADKQKNSASQAIGGTGTSNDDTKEANSAGKIHQDRGVWKN
jgi:hypothetical protein